MLTSLGHAALAAGHRDEAAERLTAAAEADARNMSASMSLVDVYRDMGQFPQALAIAQRIWETDPEAVLSGLDVAELSLSVGDFDAAEQVYDQLLEIDDEGHEAFIRYGQLGVALKREQWIARVGAGRLGGAAGAVRALPAPARVLRRPRDRRSTATRPRRTSAPRC